MSLVYAKWPITCIAGIMAIILSSLFMFISFILFPEDFNIFEMTASTLGNSSLNPNGAIFFRLSNILMGILLFPYFIGLYNWYRDEKKTRMYLYITIIIGCFMGFASIMIGICCQEIRPYHLIWATIFFLSSFLSYIFIGLFLKTQPNSINYIIIINFIIAILHIFLIFVLIADLIIFEWVIIFSSNINFIFLTYNFKKMKS